MRYLLPALLMGLMATTSLAQTPPTLPPALTVLPNPGPPTNKGLEEAGLDAFLTEICEPDALLMAGYPILGCHFTSKVTQVVPGRKRYRDQLTLYVFEARLQIRKNEHDEASPFWEAMLSVDYDSEAGMPTPRAGGLGGAIRASGGKLIIQSENGDEVPLFLNTHGASVSEVATMRYDEEAPYMPMSFELGRNPSDFDVELQAEEARFKSDP